MTHIYLSTEERRSQIMDASQHLFLTKGYEATTIKDIMGAVDIAKGTLYHHFSSKEAILVALVNRTVERSVAAAKEVAAGSGPALDRFFAAIAAAKVTPGDIELAEQFHGRDATFHMLTMTTMFDGLVPVLTGIVEEGVATGDFKTESPREAVEIVLAAGSTLLDGGIFEADSDRTHHRLVAVMDAVDKVLGAPAGSAARSLEMSAHRGPDNPEATGSGEG